MKQIESEHPSTLYAIFANISMGFSKDWKKKKKNKQNVNRFKGPEFWLLWVKLNLLGVCLVT